MRPCWNIVNALCIVICLSGCASLYSSGNNTTAEVADYRPSAALHANATQKDLWARLRAGFTLPHPMYQGRVNDSLNWYGERQEFLSRVVDRAEPYLYYITEQLEQRDMPTELALLPVVESAYQPLAYSPSNAAGIWQFIPGTARNFGLKQNWWYDGRRDILASTNAALNYLEKLHNDFNGDWLLAIAAYNCGEGTVQRAVDKNRRLGKPIDFWHLDLPEQTKDYVPRLLAISAVVDEPERYGITLRPIADEPYLANVEVGSQIDLDVAAHLADMPLADLCRLNPGFNRMATDPNGPHQLLMPADREQSFQANLAELPTAQRTRWTSHQVCRGETLLQIARNYNTDTNLLRELNKLPNNHVAVGSTLLIPGGGNPRSNPLIPSARLPTVPALARKVTQRTHTVAKGENLWSIARHYSMTPGALAQLNGLKSGAVIPQGKQLLVKATIRTKTAQSTVRPIYYKVKRGDSLAQISRRFKVSVADLRLWNDIPKQHTLVPGQRITVYVTV